MEYVCIRDLAQGYKSLKPKIAVVLNAAWNVYNFRLPLMRFLRDSGYDVIAIAPKDGYEERIKAEGFEFYDIKLSPKGVNFFVDFLTILQLRKLYKQISPSCILHYTVKPNIYGSIAAISVGIPSVATVTGLGTLFISESFASKVGRFLYKFAFMFSKKVFFQNMDDLKLFMELNLVDKKKTLIVPGSGIDTNKFRPFGKGNDISCANINNFKFLLIARILWDKGISEFVEAAKLVRERSSNVEFYILGSFVDDSPAAIPRKIFNEWAADGIIKYLGSTDDVAKNILNCDCVVLPSYREGLPRVLLEAASMQKPIIATDVPGCRDIVDDGVNGLLCRIKDAEDLANVMQRMVSMSEEERLSMGLQGRLKVQSMFSMDIVCSIYLNTIDGVLKNA